MIPSRFRIFALLSIAFAVAVAGYAQPGSQEKEKDADNQKSKAVAEDTSNYTRLRIEVTAGEKSAPVDSASVYVKYQKERFFAKDKMLEMNVKTNRDGVARLPSVPRGKVLVQVIAPGWKTYGQWFECTEAEQTIKVHLQKPPRWY